MGKSAEAPHSFALRDDAKKTTQLVVEMVAKGASGGDIIARLKIGRGTLAGILKREGLRIKRGAGLPKEPNTQCSACAKPMYRSPSEMHDTNFCDKRCVAEYLSEDIERECAQCKRAFKVPSHATPNRCCTYECSVKFRTKTVERACASCGKMFPPRGPSSKAKYCSKRCFGVAIQKRVNMACAQCGSKKKINTCHAERNAIFTCSRKCLLSFRNLNTEYKLARGKSISLSVREKWATDVAWATSRSEQLSRSNIARIKAGMKSATSAEMTFSKILDSLDIAYKAQFAYRSTVFRCAKIYDFYLSRRNILVEVHGTFWHADVRVYPDRKKLSIVQRANIENDGMKEMIARDELGMKLLIVWEKDLQENPLKIAALLKTL